MPLRNFILVQLLFQCLLQPFDELMYRSLSFNWDETQNFLGKFRLLVQLRDRDALHKTLTLKLRNFRWVSFLFAKLRRVLLNQKIERFFRLHEVVVTLFCGFLVFTTQKPDKLGKFFVLASCQFVKCNHFSGTLRSLFCYLFLSSRLESVSLRDKILGPETELIRKLAIVESHQICIELACFEGSFEEDARLLCDSRLNFQRCVFLLCLLKVESLSIAET